MISQVYLWFCVQTELTAAGKIWTTFYSMGVFTQYLFDKKLKKTPLETVREKLYFNNFTKMDIKKETFPIEHLLLPLSYKRKFFFYT